MANREQTGAPPAPLARGLAWFALAAELALIAAWIVAGALEPGYSHLKQPISELGAADATHPWIVNAGFIVMGLSIAGLGVGVLTALPRRRASNVAAALFAVAGVAFAAAGVFHLDCGFSQGSCVDRWHAGQLSWHHAAHLWTGLVFDLALLGTPFALARSLWPRPSGQLALGSGTTGVAIFLAVFLTERPEGDLAGLVERLGLGVVQIWVLIVAVGILYSTRREPQPSALTRMSPREFFEGAWSGPGELVLWPFFFWRRFPLRFEARRAFTWTSEDTWLMDDEAIFRRGWVEKRRRFFHLVEPDRIHVTADDAPEGMDMLLEEGGYRLTPYKFVVKVGPVPFSLRSREDHRLEEDGTLVDTMRLTWHGLPTARITIRARLEGGRE